MAFLGELWSAAAGTMLLFGQGWAMRLAGACLLVRAADTDKVFDPLAALFVCVVTALLAWGFKVWLRFGQETAGPPGPETAHQGHGPPGGA